MTALPCPFCGVTPSIRYNERRGWRIECCHPNCLIQPEGNNYALREFAIAAWDHRATTGNTSETKGTP